MMSLHALMTFAIVHNVLRAVMRACTLSNRISTTTARRVHMVSTSLLPNYIARDVVHCHMHDTHTREKNPLCYKKLRAAGVATYTAARTAPVMPWSHAAVRATSCPPRASRVPQPEAVHECAACTPSHFLRPVLYSAQRSERKKIVVSQRAHPDSNR